MASNSAATPVALCELLSANPVGVSNARLVSITAIAYYDFEYGYFLADNGCLKRDVFNGTGVLKIYLPSATTEDSFPELTKLSSREFLATSLGQRIYCACIGTIDYPDGVPRFVLTSAKVWAEN